MTLLKIILAIMASVVLSGCKQDEKKLFWVSRPEGHNNDFLFMAESTNVPSISSDSIHFFLSKEEIFTTGRWTFKNFGRLQKNDKYSLHVLLRIRSDTTGRDYAFLLRTYSNDYKVIDTYEMATWNEIRKQYCFGSINENLVIEKSCNEQSEFDIRHILDDGRIGSSSRRL